MKYKYIFDNYLSFVIFFLIFYNKYKLWNVLVIMYVYYKSIIYYIKFILVNKKLD